MIVYAARNPVRPVAVSDKLYKIVVRANFAVESLTIISKQPAPYPMPLGASVPRQVFGALDVSR